MKFRGLSVEKSNRFNWYTGEQVYLCYDPAPILNRPHRDLEREESLLAGEVAELERAVEAAERALKTQVRAERVDRAVEAVGAALSAPKRFWRVLTAKTPEKAPEPQPKEPPASSWMREELDRIERTKAAKKAELDRKAAEVAREAARMERLKPFLEELHQTLQRSKDDPELNEILRDTGISSWTGPRSDLVERSMWKNARAKIELLDQSRKNAGNASPSISQPEPAPQQTPRQKSGRSGPGF